MDPNIITPQPEPQNQPAPIGFTPPQPTELTPTAGEQAFTPDIQQPVNQQTTVTQPTLNYGIPPTLPVKKSNKAIVIAIAGIVLLALILIGAVIAFSQNDESDLVVNDPTMTIPSSIDTMVEETEVTAEQTETAINKIITTDFGITSTASKVIRNYTSENTETGMEVVLVYVKEVSDGSYSSGSASISSYKILTATGEQLNEASFTIGRAELTAAGYPLIYNAEKNGNELGEGWLVFQVPKGTQTLTLRYLQPETKILGGDTVAAKNYDVVLE